ncbi:MAG: TonB-dependent receptor [Chitinophaga sp.]|uniref:TonB-dependent receptor domain-containing protein n=1 Tax=Chitinophaga sp. TaxID=1869181 RepID=UPI0025C169A3|nr:TonB-dependent receptor [Chitinophaga sp.]MBV8252479.1 TonB-dependent receptor [Chitinophaga sp.]
MKATFKAIMLTTSVICAALSSHAQNNTKVTGQVMQAGDKPVEFATVTLLKASDSSLVKGAIADMNGKYEFENIKQGKYIIAAAFVGMNKVYSNSFDLKAASFAAAPLVLTANAKNLKAVDVTARRPFIEQKVDRLVVNVESSIATSGGTAMEALEKSPNITVDKDGNISMKGKSGVIILIDGKQTNMSSADVAEMLKSMPATSMDQIELISNPSAKYDAAGNAGVINLKLKKNTNFGTNGNVTVGGTMATWPMYNASLNLNHRSSKFNVFGSLNNTYRHTKQFLNVDRTRQENKGTQLFDQSNVTVNESRYLSGRIGADYFINKNNTVGVLVDLTNRDWEAMNNSATKMGYGAIVDSILNTSSGNLSRWKKGGYNVNYRGILDTTGKELNIDLDYAKNGDNRPSTIYALTTDALGKQIFSTDTSRNIPHSDITIKTAKVDYVQPLKNQARLELGLKSSFVTSDNDARFDSLRSGSWIADTMRSNHFIYKENVNAAYVNFSKQFTKLQVQVGLRAEQTNVSGTSTSLRKSQQEAIKNDTSYFNLFPSAAMTYKLNKSNSLGLSYSRRIQRPSYEDLNPFEFYIDRYTKTAGNPSLKPQYSNNFELSHTFKDFLITTVGYIHTKDMMMRILEADRDPATGDTTVLRYKYMNVAKSDNVSLSIAAPMPITKWWNSYTTMSVYYNAYQAYVNDNHVNMNAVGYFGRTAQTFTLSKTLTAEAVVFYLSPQISDNELFRMKSMWSLDLGVQQKVLKSKGTIKLNVTDLFRTQYFRGSFENAGMYTAIRNTWDSRQVRVSFNYRFGNTNVKAARDHKTGLQDEQSRVKGGN